MPGTLALIFGLIFPFFIGYGLYILTSMITKLEFNETQLTICRNGLFKRKELVIDSNEIKSITVRESHLVFEFLIHTKAEKSFKVNTFGLVLTSDNWLEPKKNKFAPESSDGDKNLKVAFTIAKSLGVPIHTKYLDSSSDATVKS